MNDIRFLTDNLIAHRGYYSNDLGIPENSISAFKRAIELNYIIELDVHILKDGNIVVFHDDNLKRMTGMDKKIKNTTYEEIKSLKLNNTNEHIPKLFDVLQIVNGKVPLLIELKYDTKLGTLEKQLIKILKDYNGLYAFQSFNPFSLIFLKKYCPSIPRGILVSNFKKNKMNILKKILLKNMFLNFLIKPDFISVNYKYLNSNRIQKYKDKKLILTWTIKDKSYLYLCKNLCDNFIVENIELLK